MPVSALLSSGTAVLGPKSSILTHANAFVPMLVKSVALKRDSTPKPASVNALSQDVQDQRNLMGVPAFALIS